MDSAFYFVSTGRFLISLLYIVPAICVFVFGLRTFFAGVGSNQDGTVLEFSFGEYKVKATSVGIIIMMASLGLGYLGIMSLPKVFVKSGDRPGGRPDWSVEQKPFQPEADSPGRLRPIMTTASAHWSQAVRLDGSTPEPAKETRGMARTRNPENARGPTVGDRYLELIRQLPLRPIRSEEELDRAIAVIASLIDRDELTPDEADYLDILGDIVEKYETEQHPMPPVSDAEMLRHLVEARGTTQARIAAETGLAESTISAILAGKRGMNRKHIETLARFFKVNPAVFISA